MPRIPEVNVEQMPAEVRAVFDKQMENFGMIFNTSKVYAHVPSIMFAASELANTIRRIHELYGEPRRGPPDGEGCRRACERRRGRRVW